MDSGGKGRTNRTQWLTLRLSEEELKDLKEKMSRTTCRRMSDYARRMLFQKPVTVKQRNQSMDDFMEELVAMRTEINQIGNNFNQVVRKINSIKEFPKMDIWLQVAEKYQHSLLQKIALFQNRLDEFSKKWLQE